MFYSIGIKIKLEIVKFMVASFWILAEGYIIILQNLQVNVLQVIT